MNFVKENTCLSNKNITRNVGMNDFYMFYTRRNILSSKNLYSLNNVYIY